MVRTPLSGKRQNSDETPLNPPEFIPEIYSAGKKIYSSTPAYSLDTHHSEIPHSDLDYWPRDSAARRLFHRNRCEQCDCDCTSDGCDGCLRRNRQCFCTAFVVVVTVGVVVLFFSSLSYNLTRKYVPSSEEHHHFSFHHHFYDVTPENISQNERAADKSKYRASIPIIEDERDPDLFWSELKKFMNEQEQFNDRRKKRSVGFEENYFGPNKGHDVKKAIRERQSKLIELLKQLSEIEEELTKHQIKIKQDPRTVFQPFSLTYATSARPEKSVEKKKEDFSTTPPPKGSSERQTLTSSTEPNLPLSGIIKGRAESREFSPENFSEEKSVENESREVESTTKSSLNDFSSKADSIEVDLPLSEFGDTSDEVKGDILSQKTTTASFITTKNLEVELLDEDSVRDVSQKSSGRPGENVDVSQKSSGKSEEHVDVAQNVLNETESLMQSNEDESSMKNKDVGNTTPKGKESESTTTPAVSSYEDYYTSEEVSEESPNPSNDSLKVSPKAEPLIGDLPSSENFGRSNEVEKDASVEGITTPMFTTTENAESTGFDEYLVDNKSSQSEKDVHIPESNPKEVKNVQDDNQKTVPPKIESISLTEGKFRASKSRRQSLLNARMREYEKEAPEATVPTGPDNLSASQQLSSRRVINGGLEAVLPTGPDNLIESLDLGQIITLSPTSFAQLQIPTRNTFKLICFLGTNPSTDKPTDKDAAQERTYPFLYQHPLGLNNDQLNRPPNPPNVYVTNHIVNNFINIHNPPLQPDGAPTQGASGTAKPPQYPGKPSLICRPFVPTSNEYPTFPGATGYSTRNNPYSDDDLDDPTSSKEEVVFAGKSISCYKGTVACRDQSSCIPLDQWCDNKVQCKDASDEAYCSCKERVGSGKSCDGYFDCPNGEDEEGCFGCPREEFSCGSPDSQQSCIPFSKRCDNVRDCPNGKDELDCAGLFNRIHRNRTFHVSYTNGFLHKNWKGEWYPVCVELGNENTWAKEACYNELGSLPGEVDVNLAQVSDNYQGHFIVRKEDGSVVIQEHCKGHVATYVKCPNVPCGSRVLDPLESETELVNRFKRYIENPNRDMKISLEDKPFVEAWDTYKKELKQNYSGDEPNGTINKTEGARPKREDILRVVGGRSSKAKAWPWVVSIYRDGFLLCGGTILDDIWIMTAAHCATNYNFHHYEVRAGVLRKFSFSPMEQTRIVSDIVVHENYSAVFEFNDVALMKLDRPLYFNRWVRPICLPPYFETVREALSVPPLGTVCTGVGWGSVEENGEYPDQLRDVELPILKKCGNALDDAGLEICAGYVDGKKDTCQGDSGGPLLCRDTRTSPSWYAAGIVSHGLGCARPHHPGAYTRVSLLLDWITANTNPFLLPTLKPLAACPGRKCSSGSKRCISSTDVCNGFVDCVNAEDEKNCKNREAFRIPLGKSPSNDQLGETKNPVTPEPEKPVTSEPEKPVTSEPVELTTSEPENSVTLEPEKNVTTESTPISPILRGKFECKTILQSISDDYVCDGKIDCEDASDEINCVCRDYLIKTRLSAICDGFEDCEDKSDEDGCDYEEPRLALSTNPELYVNTDKEPVWEREGNLMEKVNGTWSLVCDQDESEYSPSDVCSKIGLSGYLFYANNATANNCKRMYVKCVNRVTDHLSYYETSEGKYFFPWNANVYSDGVKICAAVLLEPTQWLMTSAACANNVSLSKNLLIAELGNHIENSEASSFVRINGITLIKHSDMVLFHLEKPVNASKIIQPLSMDTVNAMDFSNQRHCVALGKDHMFLNRLPECSPMHICYDKTNKSSHCGETQPWIGVIVCQSGFSWFPASVFEEKKGSCGFENAPFSNVQEKLDLIRSHMNFTSENVPEIPCDSFRCRTGLCLTSDQICNDFPDCPGEEDEEIGVCHLGTGCDPMKMKCKNGKCIHKILFGDGVDDCGDGSDEPKNVTCFAYLKLTAPHRICDGHRNCLDKTDEIPGMCPCSNHTFKCPKSGVCIPYDFVCDEVKDCPDGEDESESKCVGVKLLNPNELQITQKSMGKYHSRCASNIKEELAQKFCNKLGFKEVDEFSKLVERPFLPELDPFAGIKFNNKTKIMIRGSRPFVDLVQRDEPCETTIVKCK